MNEKSKKAILKSYNQGKSKYIRNHTLIYAGSIIAARIVLDGMNHKIITITPGLPAKIAIHAEFLIGLGLSLVLWSIGGYFFAKRQWKRIEKSYHEIEQEEIDPLSEAERQSMPVFLRNLDGE